ncbi:uncharacterized protein EURHEDRAFT_409973, partial [Aspergillus ruber CBS 135680]
MILLFLAAALFGFVDFPRMQVFQVSRGSVLIARVLPKSLLQLGWLYACLTASARVNCSVTVATTSQHQPCM